jgi:hypothetical protein
MLPLPLQFIIAMMAHAINERMARKLDYLLEEVRVLREVFAETTGRKRIPFTDEQRKRLAIAGKALTPEERETCCQLVRPKTILDWFRKLTTQRYDGSAQRRKPGRPRKADEIRALVIRLAGENIGWGYTKLRDAMRGLNIDIGRTTVANILMSTRQATSRTRKRNTKPYWMVTARRTTTAGCSERYRSGIEDQDDGCREIQAPHEHGPTVETPGDAINCLAATTSRGPPPWR